MSFNRALFRGEIVQIEEIRVAHRMTGDLGGEGGREEELVRELDETFGPAKSAFPTKLLNRPRRARRRAVVHGAVPLWRSRQFHDARLRPHHATRFLAQCRGGPASQYERAADCKRHCHCRGKRCLVRRRAGKATVAMERPRLGAIGA
jgi:hypothetical protein